MMSNFKLIAVAILAFFLAGCATNTVPDPDPTDTTYGSDAGSTTGTGDGSLTGGEEIPWSDDPSAGELGMVIYFEFDSSEVRAVDQDLVARHAMQLTSNPAYQVRLEGHADERGSREYNIGLGERRANAVKSFLAAEGVDDAQMNTISYGEERPAALGHDEVSWAENRRGVLVY